MNARALARICLSAMWLQIAHADWIEFVDQNRVRGELNGIVGAYVSLMKQESQGYVEFRYPKNSVRHVHISDTFERQETLKGIPARDPYQSTLLLETLAQRRIPYLELLTPEDETIFSRLIRSYIASGRSEDALEKAKLWRSKLRSPEALLAIDELQIIAAWNMGRTSEAAYYSKRWIDQKRPASRTALPWVVLAKSSLIEEDFESAFWTALNPIAFAPPRAPEYLAEAFEIAIVSAMKSGDNRSAIQLYEDMKAMNLAWPTGSQHASVIEEIESPDPEASRHSARSSSDARVFEATNSQPRKLVGAP